MRSLPIHSMISQVFFPTSKIVDFQIKMHFNANTAQEPTELKSRPGFLGSASLTMKAFPQAGNV